MELRPDDLLAEWKAGRFRPVYYLFGEDDAARSAALKELKRLFRADEFNFREFQGDSSGDAEAIVSEASTLPVFAERRLVIVRSSKIPAAARAALADYLKDPLKSTTVALQSEERKPDAKDALAKAAASAGAVAVFGPLREDEARQKLVLEAKKAGFELAVDAASAIVEEVGTEWGVLRQELEKALLFSAGQKKITAEAAAQCLGYQKAADPFALTRLIQDRRLKDSLSHLRRLLRDGKPEDQAFRALSQISSAVAKQWKAKRLLASGAAPEAVFRTLRLNAYWDRDFLAKLAKVPEARLRKDARLCLETEAALKSRSWLDPKIEVERLIVDLCAGANGS